MTKLYILIFLSGNLASTIGPVPYGMTECQERIAEKMEELNADDFKRSVARKNDLVMRCEFHAARPELSGPAAEEQWR